MVCCTTRRAQWQGLSSRVDDEMGWIASIKVQILRGFFQLHVVAACEVRTLMVAKTLSEVHHDAGPC